MADSARVLVRLCCLVLRGSDHSRVEQQRNCLCGVVQQSIDGVLG